MHLHEEKTTINTGMQNKNSSFCKSEISLTAYKTYLLFKMLLIKPFSKEEIIEYFKNDPIIAKKFHKDSVGNSINTLRAIGCGISRPSPSNNFKYILNSHPFKLNFSKQHISLLNTLRTSLTNQLNWHLLYKINNLYEKIISFSTEQDYYKLLKKNNIFDEINSKILSELNYHAQNGNTITISYLSPINALEDIRITANEIFMENDRLYLWCYSHKYEEVSYLRIDKIEEIKGIEINALKIAPQKSGILYKLKGNSVETFIPSEDEAVVEQNNNYIIIKAEIVSKFNFFQRILSFGQDCTIAEPESIKNEFISYLDKIAERYK